MSASRIPNTCSVWDFKDSLFRVLAAACAALGEESFRRQLNHIAAYYGEGATFDEIETLFTKDVPAKAEQLRFELASRQGYGIDGPKGGPARSHRPPLLDFDDEDLSILSPREVKVLKARCNNSLRAPAKRLRIVEGSPSTSPTGDPLAMDVMAPPRRKPSVTQATTSEAVTNEFARGALNHDAPRTGQHQPDDFAWESVAPTRKRRFSQSIDSAELQNAGSPPPSMPPLSDSFGYVTKNGEYRCALCLRQLPNASDLLLHERISEEHTRSLKDQRKVTRGRERLAQFTAALAGVQNASSSKLSQRPNIHVLRAPSPKPTPVESAEVDEIANSHEHEPSVRQSDVHEVSPVDMAEEQRRRLSTAPIQQSADYATFAPAAGPPQTLDKGKCRAASLASISDDIAYPRAMPAVATEERSRHTTAQTEIGTLNTPPISQKIDSAVKQQSHVIETRLDEEEPEISAETINSIVRSTQLAIQVLSSFQHCASARVKSTITPAEARLAINPDSNYQSHFTGVSPSPVDNSGVPTTLVLETLDDAASSSDRNPSSRDYTHGTLSAPGIGVRVGIKRGDTKADGRKRDVGEPISVIVLD